MKILEHVGTKNRIRTVGNTKNDLGHILVPRLCLGPKIATAAAFFCFVARGSKNTILSPSVTFSHLGSKKWKLIDLGSKIPIHDLECELLFRFLSEIFLEHDSSKIFFFKIPRPIQRFSKIFSQVSL